MEEFEEKTGMQHSMGASLHSIAGIETPDG
jgi:hypothetical protein